MRKKEYLLRLAENTIIESMEINGCVVIEGPKWCGKSTTAERFANSIVKLQKPAIFRQYKLLADVGDNNLLSGEKPLLFDEWQKLPELWDYIRAEIDETQEYGSFILTGSAKPIEDKDRHSGTGRIKKIVMRTMSLWESRESTGEVSLASLFEGQTKISGKQKYKLRDIAYLLCRGGWPAAVVQKDKKLSLRSAIDYVESLINTDITNVDEIKRNPTRARAVLKAYARNISTSTPMATIQKDIEANHFIADARTLDSYVNAFMKLFVIEDTEAWSPRLRSKTTIRTTNTRHFSDPSIAAAVLNAAPDDLMNDLNTFGLLFENFAVRDLKVYTQLLNGQVFNYHDKDGLEADAVIHLNNGQWGAIEIKLGGETLINEGVKNLMALSNKIDTDKMNAPSFLMVLTAADEFAYQRPDGVFVVPIGCLRN